MMCDQVFFEFDPDKAASNLEKHGVDFRDIQQFEWEDSLVVSYEIQNRFTETPEIRSECIGYIGNRLHVAVAMFIGNTFRLISLRKANRREIQRYAKA